MTDYVLVPGDTATVAELPPEPVEPGFRIIDRVAEFDGIVNTAPHHPDFVRNFGRRASWPDRTEITGITIHHTLSHSPTATARYIVNSKGYPTTQYAYWVSAEDGCPVYQCLRDEVACWHDHTGRIQTTISAGMAGKLHLAPPSRPQIEACARLCVELMSRYDIGTNEVKGHIDRFAGTVCPGWDAQDWRHTFYRALDRVNVGG